MRLPAFNHICLAGLLPFLVQAIVCRSVVATAVTVNGALYHGALPDSTRAKVYDITCNVGMALYELSTAHVQPSDAGVAALVVAAFVANSMLATPRSTSKALCHVLAVQWPLCIELARLSTCQPLPPLKTD